MFREHISPKGFDLNWIKKPDNWKPELRVTTVTPSINYDSRFSDKEVKQNIIIHS